MVALRYRPVPARLLLALAVLPLAASGAGAAPAVGATPGPSVPRLAGRVLVGAFSGTTPSPAFLARIRRGELGGVILFGGNVESPEQTARLVTTLRRAAAAGGAQHLLILVDQEGGPVRRLRWAPPSSSAATMGRLLNSAEVRLEGERAGRALRSLGIDVDLAPVADVPATSASFLGSRAFGRDRQRVAALAAAFAQGLQSAGVAATAKHFPGLGAAGANTDKRRVVVTASRTRLLRDLLPFEGTVDGGARLVMVSSAVYPTLDPSRAPALYSRPIVQGLLRDRLGFEGVVVTDSMDAPAAAARADGPARALRAGVDLLLYTSEASSATAFRTLVADARKDPAFVTRLRASNRRIELLER
jgi:beta-N-acetylhexosaminidase